MQHEPMFRGEPMSEPEKPRPTDRRANVSVAAGNPRRIRRLPFFHTSVLLLLCLALATQLRADTISGTVKDPSGSVVVGARIEITGGNLSQPIVLTADESGKFAAPNLASGKYTVRIAKEGFDDLVTPVDLRWTADL